ncbi:MAG: hypothetical protein ACR2G6_06025 [Gemmatimonadaceae bacterium]
MASRAEMTFTGDARHYPLLREMSLTLLASASRLSPGISEDSYAAVPCMADVRERTYGVRYVNGPRGCVWI